MLPITSESRIRSTILNCFVVNMNQKFPAVCSLDLIDVNATFPGDPLRERGSVCCLDLRLVLTPGSRRHAVSRLESSAKVLAAGKAGFESDRSNRSVGLVHQSPGRSFQTATVQIVDRTGVSQFMAVVRKRRSSHAADFGHSIESPIGFLHARRASQFPDEEFDRPAS